MSFNWDIADVSRETGRTCKCGQAMSTVPRLVGEVWPALALATSMNISCTYHEDHDEGCHDEGAPYSLSVGEPQALPVDLLRSRRWVHLHSEHRVTGCQLDVISKHIALADAHAEHLRRAHARTHACTHMHAHTHARTHACTPHKTHLEQLAAQGVDVARSCHRRGLLRSKNDEVRGCGVEHDSPVAGFQHGPFQPADLRGLQVVGLSCMTTAAGGQRPHAYGGKRPHYATNSTPRTHALPPA